MKRLLLLATLAVAESLSAAVPPAQRDALVALYNSAGGPQWFVRTGWLGAAGTECTWFGVVCDETSSTVRQLQLEGNGLRGTIPNELGNLVDLDQLYLTQNFLTGPIPDSLRNLKSLQLFYLGNNQLSGPIPDWIGELTSLSVIYFPLNDFTGPIPRSIRNLTNLQSLYLGNNRLTGGLPAELGELKGLGYLELDENPLGGPIPDSFWTLENLVEVRMSNLGLTGTLSPQIANLQKLDFFSMSDNELEGSLPPELGSLRTVKYLSLGRNRFSGAIPAELGQLTQLLAISLDNNDLRGEVPAALRNMTSLEDGNSDFTFNALFADAATREFLGRKQWEPDFDRYQTQTPKNVRITATTDRSATLEWDLITFSDYPGGYQVSVSTSPSGAPVAVATTASKDVSSIVVRNLQPSTNYYFRVAAVTHPHDIQKNVNTSDDSPSLSAATSARVQAAADVVVTEAPSGLVQVDGASVNSDRFTLTNFGDETTTLSLTVSPAFFAVSPPAFVLAGGASQVVTVTATLQPAGTYYGLVEVAGAGTSDASNATITLLSTTQPVGTVIAEPLSTRIEFAGLPGTDSIGSARFRNRGTATLRGIIVTDQPWIVPSADPVTIAPGDTGTVNFRVVRANRPKGSEGALTASLTLLYVDGSRDFVRYGIRDNPPPPGVGSTKVTIVDTTRTTPSSSNIPGFGSGEVALFIPGVTSVLSDAARTASDVSVVNAGGSRAIDDLKLFFTPLNASQTTVAPIGQLGTSQSLTFANILNVYGAQSGVGSLQVRTSSWQSLAARAKLVNITAAGTFTGEVPVFRSDRSVPNGESIYLTGVGRSQAVRSDLYLQETAGAPVTARVEMFDANGTQVDSRNVSLVPFGMAELLDVVPSNAVTAIVSNQGDGRLAAYARLTENATGDSWSVVDWSRVNRFTTSEAMRLPLVDGAVAASGGGGRRRAVSHATTARNVTDVTLFNPSQTDTRVRLQLFDRGARVTEREIVVPARRTVIVADAGSSMTGAVYAVVIPRGEIVMTARSRMPATGAGTAVPVVASVAGLRLGQTRRFSNIDDSTASTIANATPGTFRTAIGLVETAGAPVKVRARLYLDEGRTLVTAIIYRDFTLAAGQQILEADIVRAIVANGRDTLAELHNVQVQLEVIEGRGAVLPFLLVTDNGTGDSVLRID